MQANEDLNTAATRVCTELTGLSNVYMRQIGTFGSVSRDSGDRVISVAYLALLDIDRVDSEVNRQNNAHWADINDLPALLFDHNQMVSKAHRYLRDSIGSKPVGFQMLPTLFTLSQLQALYEAIIGTQLDKRNFRKRISEMPFIEKTEFVDKQNSRRGAALYRFNYKDFALCEQAFRL